MARNSLGWLVKSSRIDGRDSQRGKGNSISGDGCRGLSCVQGVKYTIVAVDHMWGAMGYSLTARNDVGLLIYGYSWNDGSLFECTVERTTYWNEGSGEWMKCMWGRTDSRQVRNCGWGLKAEEDVLEELWGQKEPLCVGSWERTMVSI